MRTAISFVLGSTRHGPMIFSHMDFARTSEGNMYGVGAQLVHFGAYDRDQVDTIKSLLLLRRRAFGNGVVMLDGGANVGALTVDCATFMMGWGAVIAVEPQEGIYYALCGNIALNNLFNARAVLGALDSANGWIEVPQPDYCVPGSFGSLELKRETQSDLGQQPQRRSRVAKMRIDKMEFDRLDLLKLDVEGMEIEALEGAIQTINMKRPIVYAEHAKCGKEKLTGFLSSLGYKTFYEDAGNLVAAHADHTYMDSWNVAAAVSSSQPPEVSNAEAIDKAVKLGECGRTAAALEILGDVVARDPDNPVARLNRGTLMMQTGNHEDAIAEYDHVLRLSSDKRPDAVELFGLATFSKGFAHLVLGNLREGFRGFERREVLELPEEVKAKPRLGRGFKAKTTLVVGEMGFGDNIMFARYLPHLAKVTNVIVSAPPKLAPLLRCVQSVQIHSEHSPSFDAWIRSMSLAHYFQTDFDTIPSPYVFALPDQHLRKWRSKMLLQSAQGRMRVGLCWSGSRKSKYDAYRSVPFEKLKPLFDVPGIDFYSLQLDVRDSDRPEFDRSDIYDCAKNFYDFLATACCVANLDLVVTVDTSVAHLAGSLGIPTWVMLTSFRTYWMWIRGRTDCPWYPSMRCFKQVVDGEWETVITQVADALCEMRSLPLSVEDKNISPIPTPH